MITVIAEQVSAPANAKPSEGVWRLLVPDPERWLEVTLMPGGSTKGEPWLAAAWDRHLQRRLGCAGATPAHALAGIVEGARLWREGRQPSIAENRDPRLPPDDVTIEAPAAAT